MTSPIIHALVLSGPAKGQDAALPRDLAAAGQWVWVHVDSGDEDAASTVSELVAAARAPGTDAADAEARDLVVDALVAETTRPRVEVYDEGALVILRAVNTNEGADPEDMVSIRIWVSDHMVLSVRRRATRAAATIAERVRRGHGPETPGDFLRVLLSLVNSRILDRVEELGDRTDAIEERLLQDVSAEQRVESTDLRRDALHLRRHVGPQRDAMIRLGEADLPGFDEGDRRYFAEAEVHLTRILEELDLIRERTQVIKDEIASEMTERLNRNIYLLSVISVIFLPLSFLTGLFGINVGGIPGAHWSPAFWVFSGILVVIALVLLAVLRARRWL